jgi:hypothetical protein
VPSDADLPDREPSISLENLANSVDLGLQNALLTGSKPDERFDRDLDLAAGATLMPNASDDAVHEQNRIVASLAGRCKGALGRLAREEPVSRMASDGVCVEVAQQQDTAFSTFCCRHFRVPVSHPRWHAVKVDLRELAAVPLELLGCPGGRGTDPLAELLWRRWTIYAYK